LEDLGHATSTTDIDSLAKALWHKVVEDAGDRPATVDDLARVVAHSRGTLFHWSGGMIPFGSCTGGDTEAPELFFETHRSQGTNDYDPFLCMTLMVTHSLIRGKPG
jgi:hypothetical protein